MRKAKGDIAHQTRAEQLGSIPDYLLLDVEKARELTLLRLRSPGARSALQLYTANWGSWEAMEADITFAASYAAGMASLELRVIASDRERAKEVKTQLRGIAQANAKLLQLVHPVEIDQSVAQAFEQVHGRSFIEALAEAGYFDLPFTRGPGATEAEAWPNLIAQIRRTLELIDAFELQRDVPEAEASNRASLSSHFIKALAAGWTRRSGKPPGRGRRGPFVRLVTEAWRLLGFGSPVPDDELEDWFGGRVEQTLQRYAVCQADEVVQTR